MRPFAYHRPDSTSAALAAVARSPGARFLGGGTNLVDLMRLGVERPDALVDVTALPMQDIEDTEGGGLLIGAAVPNSDLAADMRVRRTYPVLGQALLSGASGQLRNAATVGGNLLQRTRCVYFQDTGKPCNKRNPGSGCSARHGEHRDLGIIGTSDACLATHPSDMAVACAALDARVHVLGPRGARVLGLDELYAPPAADPSRDHTLARDELVVAVELPSPAPLIGSSCYRKVRDRASYAFAVASVAAALAVDNGLVRDVRLAFGAIAPRPWRARIAEEQLRGQPATGADFSAAIAAELDEARPLRDNAFKVDLTVRLGTAVLADLAQTAQRTGENQ